MSGQATVDAGLAALMAGIHPIWLRDQCGCAECLDPASGQKLLDLADLPVGVTIADVVDDGTTVSVQFEPDRHTGVYDRAWLLRRGQDVRDWRNESEKVLWTAAEVDLADVSADWSRFRDDGVHRVQCLAALVRSGLLLLRDVPARPGEVLIVAEELGFVRDTNYGRLFEVRVSEAASNLAFTARAIGPHTDNPYRDPVPTMQLLHCLINDAAGGESGLVDGFAAATRLRTAQPEAFRVLTTTPVTFRYRDRDTDLSATAPLIALDQAGRIRAVRYNSRSVHPVDLSYEDTAGFYAAYRAFSAQFRADGAELTLRLRPGDCIVLDNTRVLHSRTAFTESGERHLQGCYIDIDAVESQLRVLRR